MSSKTIDLNTIVARTEMLRQRLASVEVIIQQLQAAIGSVKTALESLSAPEKAEKMLVPGDPGFNVMLRAQIEDSSKVFYHIGSGIYAYIDKDKAELYLTERLANLSKMLSQLRGEREALASELAQLEYIIQAAIASAQRAQKSQRG